ncbi:unnamed protein product [Vitrella brassicaformis CCMP3155]|uniref:B box-type domain-containing protein n=2 Tax=Vitrella brassicaformis TaxID=1169539 RepID=A0A0G4FDU5_VITBC|nr:unnamed protein product [Vitrella brassicaformis CCMP3155]|eukprot:CEM11134.1 unnamed protein product [Vitrella brassicaformis CCMP3155]
MQQQDAAPKEDLLTIQKTEELSEFKRNERDGFLLMRGDSPLMVMQIGHKYEGDAALERNYVAEDKFIIPVGYKAVSKWGEDEIIFMTREGRDGPEYQIIYLPRSAVQEDLTALPWSGSIHRMWADLVKTLKQAAATTATLQAGGKTQTSAPGGQPDDKRAGGNLAHFEKGPWWVFGIADDAIQQHLSSDKGTTTSGLGEVLGCGEGSGPSFEEYGKYLGYDPARDEMLRWVVEVMMKEPLPNHLQQNIVDGLVYWVDTRKNESTWKHPHADKYKELLDAGRRDRPVPHWRSIAAFQIKMLMHKVIREEDEEVAACLDGGGRPPRLLSLADCYTTIKDLARIYEVDLKAEPFLAHVLRKAARYFYHTARRHEEVHDVSDFYALVQRYRDVVQSFVQQQETDQELVRNLLRCVECRREKATVFCDKSEDLLCQRCYEATHSKGHRSQHYITQVEFEMCVECGQQVAVFHCTSCRDSFCRNCFELLHMKGGRRGHVPIILRALNASKAFLPNRQGGMVSLPASMRRASPLKATAEAAHVLAKVRSHWVQFEDRLGLPVFYNLMTDEARRDIPASMLNEPLEWVVGDLSYAFDQKEPPQRSWDGYSVSAPWVSILEGRKERRQLSSGVIAAALRHGGKQSPAAAGVH